MIPLGTRYIGGIGTATAIQDGAGNTVLDFSGGNVRVVVAGGSLTPLGSAALLNVAQLPLNAKGAKIVADGTALAAAVPDYAGQLMVALDGGVGIPRTAAAGHHTDGIVFQGPLYGLSFLGLDGVAGIGMTGELKSTSKTLPNLFTIPAGGVFVDNVVYLENNSGGFTAIACRMAGLEGAAFGLSLNAANYSITSGTKARFYIEAGKTESETISATDVRGIAIRQYAGYASGLYSYGRLIFGENGVIGFYGMDVADDFTTGVQSTLGLSILANGLPRIGAGYTVSALPSASVAGCLIYVINETGGPTMAFSDGTNWRRVQDRVIVS